VAVDILNVGVVVTGDSNVEAFQQRLNRRNK